MGVCEMSSDQDAEFKGLKLLPLEERKSIARLLAYHFKEGFMVAHTYPDLPVTSAFELFFHKDPMRTFLNDDR